MGTVPQNRVNTRWQLPAIAGVCCAVLLGCAGASQSNASSQEATAVQSEPQTTKQTETKPHSAPDHDKFALIVAGAGGEENYTKKFTELASKLRDVLTSQMNFDPERTFLLTEAPTGDPENGSVSVDSKTARRSNAEEVRKAFAAIQSASKSGNLVLVVLIGHGSFDGQEAKFNLPGPDLSAKDYAALLSLLSGRRIVFVNCASSSGEFIKPLSGENRIILTATRSGSEQNATIFAEQFVGALSDQAADEDKNGRVSVLEAFNYVTKKTSDWYKQKNRLATEHALIDDNGDGTGHETAAGGDGSLAKVVYLDSKPMAEAAGDAELARLLGEKQRLEEAVEKLKSQKASMKAEEYEAALEKLLVDLAEVNQAIKARQK